jgi:branched-chain amino acid transport system substrate-binding protein
VRRRTLWLALGTLAVTAACVPGQGLPTASLPVGDPIVIGATASAAGNLFASSVLVKQGYEVWQDWINARGGLEVKGMKHPVKLVYEDDGSQADQSAQAMQKLIDVDRARFLLGPYGSILTEVEAKVADDAHIPFVVGNGASVSIYSHGYPYVFGVQSPAGRYLTGVLDLAATMNPKPTRIAILSANDSFSQEVTKAVADYAPTKGMAIVYSTVYASGNLNLIEPLVNAKAANPDILMNSGHLDEAIAINKEAKAIRLDAKLFAYSDGPAQPQFISSVGRPAASYVVTGSQWSADVKFQATYFMTTPDYVSAYKQKYGTVDNPSYITADATASAVALGRAIENANSLDPEAVRNALVGLDLQTWFGRIKFDQTGLNTSKPMIVEQIQNGNVRTVWPPEVAYAKFDYPTPDWSTRAPNTPDASPPPKLPGTGVDGRQQRSPDPRA